MVVEALVQIARLVERISWTVILLVQLGMTSEQENACRLLSVMSSSEPFVLG